MIFPTKSFSLNYLKQRIQDIEAEVFDRRTELSVMSDSQDEFQIEGKSERSRKQEEWSFK